jgi:hypothetical protein
MSSEPATLTALREFLKPVTRLKAVSLGIVGDKRHKRGYHLGKDRIFGPDGEGDADYSVQTRRDKAGLTNKASAMDIGNFKRLREMSKWIVREARANAPDTRDIREIIYSPDGDTVLRWDRTRGVTSRPREGEADNSHRTHTHISWFRNSQERDKTALFGRFFDQPVGAARVAAVAHRPAPKPHRTASKGEVVKSFRVPRQSSVCTVPKGVRLFEASDLKKVAFVIDPGRDMPFLGEPFKGVAIVHRTDEKGKPTGKALFARLADLQNIRPAGQSA